MIWSLIVIIYFSWLHFFHQIRLILNLYLNISIKEIYIRLSHSYLFWKWNGKIRYKSNTTLGVWRNENKLFKRSRVTMRLKVNKVGNHSWIINSQTLERSFDQKSNLMKIENWGLIVHRSTRWCYWRLMLLLKVIQISLKPERVIFYRCLWSCAYLWDGCHKTNMWFLFLGSHYNCFASRWLRKHEGRRHRSMNNKKQVEKQGNNWLGSWWMVTT